MQYLLNSLYLNLWAPLLKIPRYFSLAGSFYLKGMKALDRISLICKEEYTEQPAYTLGPYFQKWIMAQLPSDSVTVLKHLKKEAFSISALNVGNKIYFSITLFTEEASKLIGAILLDSSCQEIILDMDQERHFIIKSKRIQYLTTMVLKNIYYQSDALFPLFILHFRSPTVFDRHGEYVFFPDTQALFQNLMEQYSFIFERTEQIDGKLLKEICEYTEITTYCVSFTSYLVNNVPIPGFIGEVRINCQGNQVLRNYIAMLLLFVEYTGVGIFTDLGMGAVSLEF